MRIIYVVEEINRIGVVRSMLNTEDPWMAMADWLLKIHRPVGLKPGTKVGDGSLHFRSTGQCMPVDVLMIELKGFFDFHDECVREVRLSTYASQRLVDDGYHPMSGELYKSPEYGHAVMTLSSRIKDFVQGNLDVAYVLAQFAAQDTQHQFWVSRVTPRGRSLSA
ncbi:hypothetical protein RBE51_19050 [Pseudomonas taiwanensis]|uniref:hypothetical protein n=1 Tax=Pseudomonas taiwanensis TaxID=470150 RepID=UPI0028DE7228|nr:hypothetical protein [Pseudomonas taiwanensis]MDT8924888.1 hypothetical protein [Pseudomonas taiwanensis]